MSTILVWRKQLQNLYAKFSVYIIIVLKLIAGFLVFSLINSNIGFMEKAASVMCTAGLSVVCAFLPMIVMTLAASALVLIHLFELSIAVAVVTGVYFVLMYIFYFRFSSGTSWLILMTAVSFTLKVPFVVPVAVGLLGTPACIVPAACGTFCYYIIRLVMNSSSMFKADGLEGMIASAVAFAKKTMTNKEMWVMVAAVVICILLVYGVRRCSVDHAWKIASVSGVIAAVLVCTAGNIALDVHISYTTLAISGVLAIVTGLVLEILFLSVDYTRTERLEFEDDEYHYYVKAVPKFAVTVPEKSVQHINERQSSTGENTENGWGNDSGWRDDDEQEEINDPHSSDDDEDMDTGWSESNKKEIEADPILLTRSLNKELGLDVSERNKPAEKE